MSDMAQVEYNDLQLQQLFASMTIAERTRALKGAFRREANYVKKVAKNNLRSSGIHLSRGLDKGIKAAVWKRKAGFKVTILRSMHVNRFGKEKPILVFAEGGTKERQTRRGAGRGRMRKYGFMEKTLGQTRERVTDDLHQEVINSVIKAAQRYGCR